MDQRMAAGDLRELAALLAGGRHAELERVARERVARYPADGRAWQMLGVSFLARDMHQEALPPLRHSAELMPGSSAIWDNLGLVHFRTGELSQADACFRRSVELQPNQLSAWVNWSLKAFTGGELKLAEQLARRALQIEPNSPEALLGLGNAMAKLGDARQALDCFHRSIALNPGMADTYLSMGMAYEQIGRNRDAIDSYRRATELNPGLHAAHSNWLFLLTHDARLDPGYVFEVHRAFGERLEASLKPLWTPHDNVPDPERRLRIGFVSGDLRRHAVASFIESIWEDIDHERVEVLAYSNAPFEDEVSAGLRNLTDQWVRVTGLSDDALANRIRADRIDILVDLSGHTAYHRLAVFARKPAPVQVSWLGYPGTTGLTAMDYRPISSHVVPPGMLDAQFTEKLVYIPCAGFFRPSRAAPEVNALPALENGFVTFGSFNRPNKLGDEVIALWSRVLLAVPGSRMLIGAIEDAGMRQSLAERFQRHGIAPDRLEFHPRYESARYLALYHRVDMVLDSFPYTGGTTSNHAIWMGVPVLTLVGGTLPQRQGAAIVARSSLPDWVAESEADYLRKAIAAAGDLPALSELRAGLREKVRINPARQSDNAAWCMEAVFRAMWRRWCDGLPPASFEVEP